MIKDILGEILDKKKRGAMTVTINIEPSEDKDALKAEGLMPDPAKEESLEEAEAPAQDVARDLMVDDDEENEILRRKQAGEKPRGLHDRAKMGLVK